VNISLATALISYQSPRNHPEAKEIFEGILERKPTSTACLLGIGLILEEDREYAMAVDFLERAMGRDPENAKIRSELFWCKAHNDELQSALAGLEETLSLIQASQPKYDDLKAEILYRIGYCLWELDPSPTARKDRGGAYAKFLASIQADMNFAPAYTSLGTYYSDYKKDHKRAHRCFHKAFELSTAEVDSAERLAGYFAAQREWDLVEAVAQRVVDSGRAKPAPGSKRKGLAWPYAALGVVQVNRQQYAKSIVSFQAALRISPEDYQCWVGLGESYHHAGRYIAATKAFQQAESLEDKLPESERGQVWFARYMMANVQRELGEYDGAITKYKEVLAIKPDEFGVSVALLQTVTEASWKAVESGLFGEAASTAREAILTGISIAKGSQKVVNLWKAFGDAFSIFTWIKNKVSSAPIAEFRTLLESHPDQEAFTMLADVDFVGADFSSLFGEEVADANKSIHAMILSYKMALDISSGDKHSQAVAWYNLGWAEYRAHQCYEDEATNSKKAKGFVKASMRCFKRAIELEAGNSDFWNALGIATTRLSPKVAQHSFVRSLHINDKSAQIWTNLGALYLLHNDYQLASEAFTRAQSADPDFAHAWVGQGFVALLCGDVRESRELFSHAFTLSNSSLIFPKRQYALSVFDDIGSRAANDDASSLIQPLFALHQLQCQDPSNLAFAHLSGLIAERISDFSDAASSHEVALAGVEREFESSESVSALCRCAQAKADTARVKLGDLDYEAAAEDAETALSLSEEGVVDADRQAYERLRLSAHLTAGLAYYYLKDMDKSIAMFRAALQEAESDPDVICLLAQVLWAKGGEEERNVAREQLFDCVEKNPDHVGAVTLLGAIAILDSDKDTIEAVESDLQSLRTRDDIDAHSRAKITQLLAGISSLGPEQDSGVSEEQRRIHEASHSVILSPSQPDGWMALSAASAERYPAEMAIKTALRSIPPRGILDATDLCKAYVQSGLRQDALTATMVAPWRVEGWEELHHCLSQAS
jgi:superkiller protein 3